MQDFHFVMRVNKASPKLFLACANGARIKNALLTVRRSGGNPVEFLKWTLTDVAVASYQTAASVASGEAPTDQVSLRFTKIEMEYTPGKTRWFTWCAHQRGLGPGNEQIGIKNAKESRPRLPMRCRTTKNSPSTHLIVFGKRLSP